MTPTSSHKGDEALVFVAFATKAVLFDTLGGEVLIDGETIGIVSFLVSDGVVNLNDLVALEAGAVEGSSDAIPKLGAWLDWTASDTRRRRSRSRRVRMMVMVMMMVRLRITRTGLSFLHHWLVMVMVILMMIVVVLMIEHLLLLLLLVTVVVETTTS